MFLQTLLQLNILILATPALAGWSLLPPTHSNIAGIVWQYRGGEAAALTPQTQVQVGPASKHLPASVSSPVSVSAAQTVIAADSSPVLISSPAFRLATRAP